MLHEPIMSHSHISSPSIAASDNSQTTTTSVPDVDNPLEKGTPGDFDSDLPPLKRKYHLLDVKPDHVENGIPVFKPTWDEFKDFYVFQKSINKYGMESGIVKVIPPKEWIDNEMPEKYSEDILSNVQFKSPITQEFTNHENCYSINNIEKKKTFNLLQWKRLSYQQNYLIPALKGEKDPFYHKPTADDLRRFNYVKGNSSVVSEEAIKGFNYNIDTSIYTKERCEYLENQYWKTISFSTPLYGADSLGSLFGENQSIWNVAKLPNLLDWLPEKLPGVNDAYLYGGLWKASFSWHLEDQDLYSINYLHFGAPKQWYSIPQKDHMKFYHLMSNIFRDDYESCSEFLRHKTFLASPLFLRKRGIEVNKITHYEKEFIITYPYGYHSGFNYGYNLAESVNFALDDWIDIGLASKRCMCIEDSVGINVEKLVKRLNGDFTETEEEVSSADEEEEVQVEEVNETKTQRKQLKPKFQQCILCPNTFAKRFTGSHKFELLDVVDCDHYGKGLKNNRFWKCHRLCAELTPELHVIKRSSWLSQQVVEVDSSSTPEVIFVSTSNDNPSQGDFTKQNDQSVIPISSSESIEPKDDDNGDVVLGYEDIPKARKNLKCMVCSTTEFPDLRFKGVCFQCSYGKCTRAYHATCGLNAGVLLSKDENGFLTGLCRYHRPLTVSPEYSKAYLENLTIGDLVQFKLSTEYYAGHIISNNNTEGSVNLSLYNTNNFRIENLEVSYSCILVPSDDSGRISLEDYASSAARRALEKRQRREQREKERQTLREERLRLKEERRQERLRLKENRKLVALSTPKEPFKYHVVSDYELSSYSSDDYSYMSKVVLMGTVYDNQDAKNYVEMIKPIFVDERPTRDVSGEIWYYMPNASSEQTARYRNDMSLTVPNDAEYYKFLRKKEVEKVRLIKRIQRQKRKLEELNGVSNEMAVKVPRESLMEFSNVYTNEPSPQLSMNQLYNGSPPFASSNHEIHPAFKMIPNFKNYDLVSSQAPQHFFSISSNNGDSSEI